MEVLQASRSRCGSEAKYPKTCKQETTLFTIITNLLHFGMTVVFAGQMNVDEITGGAPYGATTIAELDAQRQPSENELAGARYQGRAIAESAAKLHG